MQNTVIVIGGGVAGLATAFELQERGLSPLVVEASDRLGGNIRTAVEDGFTLEWGPNGFLDNVPETLDLVRRLGAQDRLQVSSDAARKRFLWRKGKLRALPEGPSSFLRSPLLSLRGRLRVLREPFAAGPPDDTEDESVHAFATRRIGREAADVLVDAMVSGVFAGDARRLSLRSTFPKMYAMEREHGSLFAAMKAKGKARRAARKRGEAVAAAGPAGPGGRLTSFRDGFEELIRLLAQALAPGTIRTDAPVAHLEQEDDAWRVVLADGERFETSQVVLAAPAWHAAGVVRSLDPDLARELDGLHGAGLAVVAAAWRDEDLPGPLDGFGFLVPRTEGLRSLGTLWDSSVFPGRAPPGWALLRTMVGGAHDPEGASLPDEGLLATVRDDLRTTMGIEAAPRRTWIFRHGRGIPQYERGHGARLDRIEALCRGRPGLHLTGNSYRGVSVNLCVVDAKRVAQACPSEAGLGARRVRGRGHPRRDVPSRQSKRLQFVVLEAVREGEPEQDLLRRAGHAGDVLEPDRSLPEILSPVDDLQLDLGAVGRVEGEDQREDVQCGGGQVQIGSVRNAHHHAGGRQALRLGEHGAHLRSVPPLEIRAAALARPRPGQGGDPVGDEGVRGRRALAFPEEPETRILRRLPLFGQGQFEGRGFHARERRVDDATEFQVSRLRVPRPDTDHEEAALHQRPHVVRTELHEELHQQHVPELADDAGEAVGQRPFVVPDGDAQPHAHQTHVHDGDRRPALGPDHVGRDLARYASHPSLVLFGHAPLPAVHESGVPIVSRAAPTEGPRAQGQSGSPQSAQPAQ
ncbi:MAG: protoporphyrinogen oxidase [Planctomycetota bacterium]|jgi:oxygen-dependent protoporphyrinogen oxidase